MAYVIDRTTKEISTRDTVSAQKDPACVVLRYRDRQVPADVLACPPQYRVIEGDAVRVATEADRYAIDNSPEVLAAAKASKIAEINARTRQLIVDGCEVAPGVVVSTSEAAQLNFYGILGKRGLNIPYVPQPISTVDDGVYVIRDEEDLLRVAGLLDAAIKGPQMAGQVLRMRVAAAKTREELDAIVDERT